MSYNYDVSPISYDDDEGYQGAVCKLFSMEEYDEIRKSMTSIPIEWWRTYSSWLSMSSPREDDAGGGGKCDL